MKNKILYFLITIFSFSACQDYLDVVPEDDVLNLERIFQKKKDAMDFFNGCYVYFLNAGSITIDPAIAGSEEFTTGEYLRNKVYSNYYYKEGFKIAEGLQNPSNPIMSHWSKNSNYYNGIRRCNIFIENVDKVYNMTQEEKFKYKAHAKSIKALYYFELLRMYGPIILVPENISVEADIEDMQIPRSPIDTCINEIVRLLDEAKPYIEPFESQPTTEYGYLTREAVYALKAKALLYAASPLFNGNSWYTNFKNRDGIQLFSKEISEKKWERAAKAIDEAVNFCESHGRKLETGHFKEGSEKLNIIRDIQRSTIPIGWESDELIYGINSLGSQDFALRLPRYNENDLNFNAQVIGCLNPTMRMVELFYTENGLPIDMDKNWDYTNRYKNGIERDYDYNNVVALNKEVLNLHLRREPRFYADIACDRCIWLRGNDYVEMNPYREGIHGINDLILRPSSKVNITGYWVKKLVDAQVVGGRMANLLPVAPFPKIRLAELYLMQAEAWNEFSGPGAKAFEAINKIRKRAGIPDLQEAWSNFSKDPNKPNTKEGLRDIIRQETLIEMAFEGHRFWNLRRWKVAHEYYNRPVKGWNIYGKDNDSFYNNYEGPKVVWDKNKFESPRDYFWPLKDEEVLKANIKQNLGW